MFFTDELHKESFIKLLKDNDRIHKNNVLDTEYSAIFYILSSDMELRNKCLKYIKEDGIYITEMLEEQDFSTGYAMLIKLAAHLFNRYNEEIDMVSLIGALDNSLFKVAMNGILLRRGKYTLEDIK